MDESLNSRKKILVLAVGVVFLLATTVVYFYLKKSRETTSSQTAPTPKTIPPSPDVATSISPLQRAVVGQTKTNEINALPNRILKETFPDGLAKYEFKSEIPQRPDTIEIKDGTVAFERLQLPEDRKATGYKTILEYALQFGEAERVIQGSEFYGPFVSTYIYASQGFALIGNAFTDEVYEVHVFAPTTVEDYILQWGDDINEATPEPEYFGLSGESEDVSVFGVSTEEYTPQAVGDGRAWPLNIVDNKGEFICDLMCALPFLPCVCSDLDESGPAGPPSPGPGPEPTIPGQPPRPPSSIHLDYYIPFREHRADKVNALDSRDGERRILRSFPKAKIEYYDRIVSRSRAARWNPAFVLTLWVEETGGSTTTTVRKGGACTGGGCSRGHLGCAPTKEQTMNESLNCLFNNFDQYGNDQFAQFMARYSGGPPDDPFANNPNFPKNIKFWYSQFVLSGSGAVQPL